MKMLNLLSSTFPNGRKSIVFTVATSALLGTMLATTHAEPPVTVESQTAATAGKPVLVVSDSGKSQTIDAEGRDISIDGNKNDVTLRGKCHALTVSGNENTVHAAALATISTPGNRNHVTWMETVDGEKPQITDGGSGNSIEHSSK